VSSEQCFELGTAAVHRPEAVAVSGQYWQAEAAVESTPVLVAVLVQELAFVSAHRLEVVELSARHLAQRLVAASGTARRPAVVEEPEVNRPHL
jgi:hypothetical protein